MTDVLLLQEAGGWNIDAISRETPWTPCCNVDGGRDVAIMLKGSAATARAWTWRGHYSIMAFVLDDPTNLECSQQWGMLCISAHFPDQGSINTYEHCCDEIEEGRNELPQPYKIRRIVMGVDANAELAQLNYEACAIGDRVTGQQMSPKGLLFY
eukprot:5630453-Karenia_brevis.AAC.1